MPWYCSDHVGTPQSVHSARETAWGADIPEKWPKERYDIVLLFRLQEDGVTYSFRQVPQMLLAGNRESLIEDFVASVPV